MTEKEFDDETVMAFVDGELDSDTSNLLEEAMEFDPDLVKRVEAFAQTRSLAQKSFHPLLNEPVPNDLLSNVEAMLKDAGGSENSYRNDGQEDTVVAFKPAVSEEKKISLSQRLMPLAASIAIVAAGITGFAIGTSTQVPSTGDLQIAEFNQPGLLDALQTVTSGEEKSLPETGDRMRVIASFRDVGNDFCREFEVDQKDRTTFVSVACLREGQWKLHFTVAATSQNNDGYAPASSLEALDAYLVAVGAGSPMTADDEAKTLKQFR